MARSLGIVVPAYDPDVERLLEYAESLAALDPAEVRIELDAPSRSARELLAAAPATVEAVAERRGKGAAVTAGFEALETDVYAFVDADGSTSVESLRRVVEAVADGAADLATGSRRHPDASVRSSQTPVRERLGDGYAWLARRALPISLHDYQCGAKAVDAAAWATVRDELYEPGFGWDVELLAAAARRGCAVAEVPIEWEDRSGSTVNPLRAAPSFLRALARGAGTVPGVATRASPLRRRLAEED